MSSPRGVQAGRHPLVQFSHTRPPNHPPHCRVYEPTTWPPTRTFVLRVARAGLALVPSLLQHRPRPDCKGVEGGEGRSGTAGGMPQAAKPSAQGPHLAAPAPAPARVASAVPLHAEFHVLHPVPVSSSASRPPRPWPPPAATRPPTAAERPWPRCAAPPARPDQPTLLWRGLAARGAKAWRALAECRGCPHTDRPH